MNWLPILLSFLALSDNLWPPDDGANPLGSIKPHPNSEYLSGVYNYRYGGFGNVQAGVIDATGTLKAYQATLGTVGAQNVTVTGELSVNRVKGYGGDAYPAFTIAASNSLNSASANFTCTGSNDWQTVQNAVNLLPNGGTIRLLGGSYVWGSNTVRIATNGIRIVGEAQYGPYTTLNSKIYVNSATSAFYFDTANQAVWDCAISDFEIDGNFPVVSSLGIVSAGAYPCNNLKLENLYIQKCSWGILFLSVGSENLLVDKYFGQYCNYGIFTWYTKRTNLQNCWFYQNNLADINCNYDEDMVVFHNRSYLGNAFVDSYPTTTLIVDGNIIKDSTGTAIYIDDGYRNKVVKNHISLCRGTGIDCSGVNQTSVSDNFIGNANNGIYFYDTNGGVVANNQIYYTTGYGIDSWNNVHSNIVYLPGATGIVVRGNYTLIQNNDIIKEVGSDIYSPHLQLDANPGPITVLNNLIYGGGLSTNYGIKSTQSIGWYCGGNIFRGITNGLDWLAKTNCVFLGQSFGVGMTENQGWYMGRTEYVSSSIISSSTVYGNILQATTSITAPAIGTPGVTNFYGVGTGITGISSTPNPYFVQVQTIQDATHTTSDWNKSANLQVGFIGTGIVEATQTITAPTIGDTTSIINGEIAGSINGASIGLGSISENRLPTTFLGKTFLHSNQIDTPNGTIASATAGVVSVTFSASIPNLTSTTHTVANETVTNITPTDFWGHPNFNSYFYVKSGMYYSGAGGSDSINFNGSSNTQNYGEFISPTSAIPASRSWVATIYSSTPTEASSGTHPLMAQIGIKEVSEVNAAGTTTMAAQIYIEGNFNKADEVVGNPTRSYGIYVNRGTSRIADRLIVGSTDSTTSTSPLVVHGTVTANAYNIVSDKAQKENIIDATEEIFSTINLPKLKLFDFKKPPKPSMPINDITGMVSIGIDKNNNLIPLGDKEESSKAVRWVSAEIVVRTKEQVYQEECKKWEWECSNSIYQKKHIGFLAQDMPSALKNEDGSWGLGDLVIYQQDLIDKLGKRIKKLEDKN